MKFNFLETLQDQVIILDGAMGTMIQELDLDDQDFGGSQYKMLSDILTFSKPDELKKIHLKYFQSGANAIETNTFGASKLRLQEYDFTKINTEKFAPLPENINLNKLSYNEFAYHLNKAAANIAVSALNEYRQSSHYDGRPLFVIGSIGPSNFVLSSTKANLNRATYAQIVDNFYHQTLGLIDGGADVLLFETQQDQLELKAGIHGAQKAMTEKNKKLPIMAQITVDQFGKMQIFNTDVLAAMTTVQGIGIDVFGINCSIGPDLMIPTVEKITKHCQTFVSVIPNAGLPSSENGKTVFKLTPEELAQYHIKFITEYGVNIVGGCCGTRPEHIAAISAAVKNLKPKKRVLPKVVSISGPQNMLPISKQENLVRIGERLNVRGSLKVRQAVENNGQIDFESLEEVVVEQVRDLGVPLIDVCMDSNLVNTEKVLVDVIKELTTDFSGVMCLDSFSVEALLAAIEAYPGRPLLNSISLEEYSPGVDKIDAVVAPTKQHDPIYIALTTGPQGPAITAQEKQDLARQIFEKCQNKYQIRANQLIIDVNAFPIGAENDDSTNFAMESLNAIPLIKKIHPDLMVSMGVGNLTNGLAKKPYMRKLLTSVFMEKARALGMDMAIINPHHYVPVSSLDPDDVKLALSVIEKRDMDAFAELEIISERKKGGVVEKRLSYDDLSLEKSICQKIKDGFKQRQKGTITLHDFEYEYEDTIVLQTSQALEKHPPLDFINNYLMVAMKELGDGFGSGDVSLPHLLKSADVMKHAMRYIEAYMKQKSGKSLHDEVQYKGVVVLGTVYQDVHSIGKDLVKTLLENYGYRVIDLGVQTPLQSYIDAVKQYQACAIGMSALLVQTSNHMITVAKMLKEEGLESVDILIGGAPVNKRHAAYVSMWGQNDLNQQLQNVFYCASGMDGVNTMNQLKESVEKRQSVLADNAQQLKYYYEQALKQSAENSSLLNSLPRRVVDHSQSTRSLLKLMEPTKIEMTLQEFLPHLNLKTLFSLNWNYGGKKSWDRKGVTEQQLQQQLHEWVEKCDQNGWLKPQGVFALFPCWAKNDEVLVYHPQNIKKQVATIPFSVVVSGDKTEIFSTAQYFLNESGQKHDVIGLQISTGGHVVENQIEIFKQQGDNESALFLQGLSDRVAEDMADYIHQHVRQLMGVSPKDGTRYSPGYPGLQDLSVNHTLAELLDAQTLLGIKLTDIGEFAPTGTTGAVVCFHPLARYD